MAISLLALLAGCARLAAVECDDGTLCPAQYRCDTDNHRCLSPGQLAACAAPKQDGDACTILDEPGTCATGACIPHTCGDGIREDNEQCDGADLGGADCTSFAQIHARFYDRPGLGCTAECTYDIAACTGFCGDGTTNGPEVCDGTAPPGACTTFGYDAGAIGCDDVLCSVSFAPCARFGWTFEPIAGGAATFVGTGVTGTGHADQWIVGNGGLAAHYTGSVWTVAPTSTTRDLLAASAIANGEVWAASDREIVHWSGSAWTTLAGTPDATTASYTAIYAHDASAIFVGTGAGVVAYDGAQWMPLGALATRVLALDGTSANDVYAATDAGVQHWNGAAWSLAVAMHAGSLFARNADDVWASGDTADHTHSVYAHWDGTAWTTIQRTNTGGTLVTATAPHDVWFVRAFGGTEHFDGAGFAPSHLGATAIGGMHAFGPADVVVSAPGGAYRFTGQSLDSIGVSSPIGNSIGMWMDRADDIVVADLSGRIAKYDGAYWTTTASPALATRQFLGLGPADWWLLSTTGDLFHYDGTWHDLHTGYNNAFLAGRPGDLWVAEATAQGAIAHFDGTTWTTGSALIAGLPADGAVTGIAAGPDGTVVVTVERTEDELYRWTGSAWTLETSTPDTVGPVVVASHDRIVATLTSLADVLQFDGTTWTRTTLPLTDVLSAHLVAIGADDIFVFTGSHGEVAHWDGARWSPVAFPLTTASGVFTDGTAARGQFVMFETPVHQLAVLTRVKPWTCSEDHETACDDGIDNDCDGLVDDIDPDCP